ncbi:MAG TPA: TIGR04255 family protein [Phycisphaerae bacterium]|nr:TIGR04255 family protein [Phycisphaerae bacterium]
MSETKRYKNAPVVEALINVSIPAPDAASPPPLDQFLAGIGQSYKLFAALGNNQLQVTPQPGQYDVHLQIKHTGWSYLANDGKFALQVRPDGISLSRLTPYENWEALRDEFIKIWNDYQTKMNVKAITKIEVRYINRFEFPLPMGDLKDYLLTVPEIAKGLPQAMAGFLMQVMLAYPDIESWLTLNETILPPHREDGVSIMLDIDLFREKEIPIDFFDLLESLRRRKNEVFEACITDKTRRLIS